MRQAPEALARRARLPRNRVPDRGVRELRCPGRRAVPPARPAPQARPEWTTPERPGLRERALLPLRLRRTPGRTAQPAIPRLRVASPAAARPAPTRVDRRPACLRVARPGTRGTCVFYADASVCRTIPGIAPATWAALRIRSRLRRSHPSSEREPSCIGVWRLRSVIEASAATGRASGRAGRYTRD